MKNRYILGSLGIILFFTIIFAGSGGWYIVSNPIDNNPEAVWSAKGDSDASYEIRYSYLDRTEWISSTTLTSDSVDDYDPNLVFDSNGNRKVIWWADEDYDRIKYSASPASGGSWSDPIIVSNPSENCRYPSIVVHESKVHISYERINSSGDRSVLTSSEEGLTPWPENHVALTQRTANLLTRMHSVAGHLWVDWIDSDSDIGYSQFIGGTWESPQYESYSGEDDIVDARQRIRQAIVGN